MLFIWNLLFFSANSQNSVIEVTYNSQSISIYNSDLTVSKLKIIFKIPEFDYLEDLSGKIFYPFPDGSFILSISTVVFVRQLQPKKMPTVIDCTEGKMVTSGPSDQNYWVGVGYVVNGEKHSRRGFIHFKDLSKINTKKKVSKVFLRIVGEWAETFLPVQIFVHRCETDWDKIVNWWDQPVFRYEPYSSIIAREISEISFYLDVTDIVNDWLSGSSSNFGVVIKANNTIAISTAKNFYAFINAVKKPVLLVYYSD